MTKIMKHFKTSFKPGIHLNVPEKVYRADGGLSTSDFKLIGDTPKKFKAQIDGKIPRVDSAAFRMGTLFHMYALEREEWNKTVIVCPEEYNDRRLKDSKAWWKEQAVAGKEVIKADELEAIGAMYDSYHALEAVTEATQVPYDTEASVFCQKLIGKNDTKCRVDLMTKPVGSKVMIVDIKTCQKDGASPNKFAQSSRLFKYGWQQHNYTRMLAQHGIEVTKWVWAVVEKEPPYVAAEYTFSKADMDYVAALVKEADRKLLAAQELNSWPSWTPSGPVELNIYGGVNFK